jgi:hypothetical protein
LIEKATVMTEIETGDTPKAVRERLHEVRIFYYLPVTGHVGSFQARCKTLDCGWSGFERNWRGVAEIDAGEHQRAQASWPEA